MTSNIGVKKIQDFGSGVGFKTSNSQYVDEENRKLMLQKELKSFFSPEFLNRIDDVIIFNSLKKDEIKQIVFLETKKLSDRLIGLGYDITFEESLIDMISDVGFDEMYGARPVKRAIQDKIEDFISEEVLRGNMVEKVKYTLYYDDGNVKYRVEGQRKTRGRKKKGD